MNIVEISVLLGHEQLATAMRYLDISTEDQITAMATLEDENKSTVSAKWKNSSAHVILISHAPSLGEIGALMATAVALVLIIIGKVAGAVGTIMTVVPQIAVYHGTGFQCVPVGADLINGIVNGIRSCIGNVASAISDVGPLTDYESWMPDFI